MSTQIFVNLAVKDLSKSKQFFTKLGFTFNPKFEDETGACLVIAENISAMLLTHDKFRQFTTKQIADTSNTTEVLNCLSFDNKHKVDKLVDAALAAGGHEPRPALDYGFMYGRSFEDLDGHIWEIVWMDPKGMPEKDNKK